MAVSIRETLSGLGNKVKNPERMNLNKMERWASVLGGAALAAYALRRRNKGSLGLAALGAPLIWRGATGHCSVYEKLGIDRNPEHLNTASSASSLSSSTGHTTSVGDSYDQDRVKTLTDVNGTEGRPVVTTDRQPIGQNF